MNHLSIFRRAISSLVVILPSCVAQESASSHKPPRVVVMCSVDQLASWVFDQSLPHFGEGGFRRLLREGVQFAECAYLQGCTETGPGHATLGTGAPANVHGIVHNEWYDEVEKKRVYCAGEPVAALAEFPEGKDRGPARLLVPTLGDLLKQKNPAARLVSVSAKDRSAILMAGGSADSVTWYDYSTGRFVTNTRWCKEAPKWLLDFNQAPAADAYFGWQWTRTGPDKAYADCVDDQPFEAAHLGSGGRTLPATLKGKPEAVLPAKEFYLEVYISPAVNELTLRAAKASCLANQVGEDDVTDLLCLSFSATDTIGHAFGPESVEARDGLLRLDALLAELLLWLDARVGRGNYTFLLSADHGVGHSPEWVKQNGGDGGRGLLHTMARGAAENALKEHFAAAKVEGAFVAQASEFSLVLDRERVVAAALAMGKTDAAAAFWQACEIAAQAAAKSKGVQQAFVTEKLVQGGATGDPIRRAMFYAARTDRAGDVLLVLKPNWLEGTYAASHGSPYDYDRRVPLLAMGPGLARGTVSQAKVSPGLMTVIAAKALVVPTLKVATDTIPAEALQQR